MRADTRPPTPSVRVENRWGCPPEPRCARDARGVVAALLGLGALVFGCHTERRPAPDPSAAEAARPAPTAGAAATGGCGDVVGAWSGVVDGLRGRLVTAGSRADGSGLRVTLELQNVSPAGALEINWEGGVHLGFVRYALLDATGRELPEPDWRLGGNEPAAGNLRQVIPAAGVVRQDVGATVFENPSLGRVLRIGAFWARELPRDGARRLLRARLEGHPPGAGEPALVVEPATENAGETVRQAVPGDARGRAWTGPLELPPVCVD